MLDLSKSILLLHKYRRIKFEFIILTFTQHIGNYCHITWWIYDGSSTFILI